ncbi:RodZ domain-containing protein [Bacillus sp. FJAT-50079]|uniref:helix-turn-helix domain-containing protein n=1 Tax=Bacillus sp. FJAT-50079 TaxID=2833577 RepID=UPI001BC9244E|nr:RodZ domain-containing protein [Bacillus sp. FJAT-50079]MBS4207553.1 helix-turn-helix domain-containing protein [Bacillus sp. FJAT-50079]
MTELGSRLRARREEKNLSLDELQRMTRIQKKYLIGIEEGNYSIMPGKFYARAFIKQYAEAVGLNPEELFDEFKSDIPPAYEDDLPEQLSRVQSRSSVSTNYSKLVELFPKIIFGIAILALIVFIYFIVIKNYNFSNKTGTNQGKDPVNITESNEAAQQKEDPAKSNEDEMNENADTEDEQTDEQPEPPAQVLKAESVAGNVTTYSLAQAQEFVIEVKATDPGNSWFEIKNENNQSVFSRELKNGETESVDLTGQSETYITIGKAPDAEIYINGERLEYELAPQQNITQYVKIMLQTEE